MIKKTTGYEFITQEIVVEKNEDDDPVEIILQLICHFIKLFPLNSPHWSWLFDVGLR